MNYPTNRLRELRNSKDVSGVDVAEAINITPQYYYELEKGEKRLNEDLLRKLAEFFNTTTDYLLRRTNDPTPIETIAAHHDAEEYTEEELEDIEKFKEFVRSKRGKKPESGS